MIICKRCGKTSTFFDAPCDCIEPINTGYEQLDEHINRLSPYPMKKKVEKGLRHNSGKRRMDLIPISTLNALADVLGEGAKKYDERNWEKGMKHSICYASLMRHITKWFNGEDLDDESGLPHLHHALCNIAFLVEYRITCPELDDRVKK